MRSKPAPDCYLCGSPGAVRYAGLKDRLFGAGGEWSLSACPRPECGLWWLDPMPLTEDLSLAYEEYFTHEQAGGLWKWHLLMAAYRALFFLPEVVIGLRRSRRRSHDVYLDGLRPGRLLDVGCGDGRYLHRMKLRGWEVSGLDFDAAAVAAASRLYDITVHHGDLLSMRLPECSYDAIVLSHVIEHVPDPIALLAECRRLLRSGGRLVAVTPNTASQGHRLFQKEWLSLDPPRHLHLFNPVNLAACARRAGIDECTTLTTAANSETVYSGSLAIRQRGRHIMSGTPQPELWRGLRATWLQYVNHLRLNQHPGEGEELVLIGRR